VIGDLITPFKATGSSRNACTPPIAVPAAAPSWLSASAMPALVSTHVMAFAASIASQGRAPLLSASIRAAIARSARCSPARKMQTLVAVTEVDVAGPTQCRHTEAEAGDQHVRRAEWVQPHQRTLPPLPLA
jgi:hypothetical protein